jgi:CRP-like cAMP-binding protein
MSDLVIAKLGTALPAPSQLRLREILGHRKHLRPHEDLARQGDIPQDGHFVLEGILCRYKLLTGGRRAVVAYLLPGDFCGPHPDIRRRMDHGISSLTPAIVAEVPHNLLQECLNADRILARSLAAALMAEAAIQRQWLANMGCPSDRRLAHLLCELRARLARVGLADGHRFQLPLTQHELSEAIGISTVHVNRVLQHLKDIGLVRIADRQVIISDLAQLESFAEFDPAYLAMDGEQTPARFSAGG